MSGGANVVATAARATRAAAAAAVATVVDIVAAAAIYINSVLLKTDVDACNLAPPPATRISHHIPIHICGCKHWCMVCMIVQSDLPLLCNLNAILAEIVAAGGGGGGGSTDHAHCHTT